MKKETNKQIKSIQMGKYMVNLAPEWMPNLSKRIPRKLKKKMKKLEAQIQDVLDRHGYKHFIDLAYKQHLFGTKLRFPFAPQDKEEKS